MQLTHHFAVSIADKSPDGASDLARGAIALLANLIGLALAYASIAGCSDTLFSLVTGLG